MTQIEELQNEVVRLRKIVEHLLRLERADGVVGGLTTLSNGLHIDGTTGKLGGTLVEHTTIGGNSIYNLTLSALLLLVISALDDVSITSDASTYIQADTGLYLDGTTEAIVSGSEISLQSATLKATYTGAGVTPTELVGRDAVTGKFAPVAGTSAGLTHPQVLARTLGA